MLRGLGPRAQDAFDPHGGGSLAGLVRLPPGQSANALGLRDIAPGFGRLTGTPAAIISFSEAHPELGVEIPPTLHLLLDIAGPTVGARSAEAMDLDGTGTLIGIADTGIDLTHPDFLDEFGHTRVAWLLDLSSAPRHVHPDLEQTYGTAASDGTVVAGAVWSAEDINLQLPQPTDAAFPSDSIGHGTLVASCAAGGGLTYRGVAPRAGLLVARISGTDSSSIGGDELLRSVAFFFDRAAFMNEPVVVNLSVGTDYGPHDGTTTWEQALAAFVGPSHPGRALVAAAGNSGSPDETPIHQQVHLNRTVPETIPMQVDGATSGGVEVWVALHPGATMKVGLNGPDGTWITPVAAGASASVETDAYSAAIYNGSQAPGGSVPATSSGAEVMWQGAWPQGTYSIVLDGSGVADLYVAFTGDANLSGLDGFSQALRDGTINLPATHPDILSVGCTLNKTEWLSTGGDVTLPALPQPYAGATGEPCWFSSAGPTLTGVAKPEIMAPGAAIVGALSSGSLPSSPYSLFNGSVCPVGNESCMLVDSLHGVSMGTSFSAPLVAGAVAIMLQSDPTLTEDVITSALRGGAHRLRANAPFDDQAGTGELDIRGALAVLEQRRNPVLAVPSRIESWLTLGADPCLADGSTPFEAFLELRSQRVGTGSADPAGGFDPTRLAPSVRVDSVDYDRTATITSLTAGAWLIAVRLPAGLGGRTLTLGATFDGVDIVNPKSVPIAVDATLDHRVPTVMGGCSTTIPASDRAADGGASARFACAVSALFALGLLRRRGRRSRRNSFDREHPAVRLPLGLIR